MKASLFFVGVFVSFGALAQGVPVPHVFNSGEPIVASEFNANFQELSDRNDTTQTEVTNNTTNVSGNQSSISTIQGTLTVIQSDITTLQSNSGASLFQFVGNSTGTADGDDGIRVMTQLCQADFVDSRICTSEEYAKTVSHPVAIPASEAWILPSNITTVGTAGVNDTFSGRYASSTTSLNVITCSGWTTTTSTGLAVSPTGGFSIRNCTIVQPVACCK